MTKIPHINKTIDIGQNVDASGSNIGNTSIYDIRNTNIYKEKSEEELFDDAIKELKNNIRQISEDTIRASLLENLHIVKSYFNDNVEILYSLLRQVNCDIDKTPINKYASIFEILNFLILALLVDEKAKLPDRKTQKTVIKNIDNWIFNAAETSDMRLEMHFSKIADFLGSNPSCGIKDGICFITKLINNGGLNCNNCLNGCFHDDSKFFNILTDWMKTSNFENPNKARDFFDLQYKKNITFKCG
jgi:hypothetical protein